jgi:kynurenine formamidase
MKIVDLSHVVHETMPTYPTVSAPKIETLSDVRQGHVNVQLFTFPSHLGTHLDAPLHHIKGGKTIDEFPPERFVGDAVIVAVPKNGPEPIEVEDVVRAGAGVQPRPGDMVFLSTGCGDHYGTELYFKHPYISEALARWLVERQVSIVGVDFLSADMPYAMRPPGYTAPAHKVLLGNEVLIIENLANLGAVAGRRVRVCALPINVKGGDGALARVVAMED